eukprot:6340918-Alexandrium_andersonii.AAC.1
MERRSAALRAELSLRSSGTLTAELSRERSSGALKAERSARSLGALAADPSTERSSQWSRIQELSRQSSHEELRSSLRGAFDRAELGALDAEL